jgi:hypothetical protein
MDGGFGKIIFRIQDAKKQDKHDKSLLDLQKNQEKLLPLLVSMAKNVICYLYQS